MNITYDDNRRLPYITLHPQKLLCLIDTGSSRSFIRPDVAEMYFPNQITPDKFSVKTPHGVSHEMNSVSVPIPTEFKCNDRTYMRYHVFNFHSYFDCLIGMDILESLRFSIDLKRKLLTNEHVQIPLQIRDSNPDLNVNSSMQPQEKYIGKLHTEIVQSPIIDTNTTGDIFIPHTQLISKHSLVTQDGVTSASKDKEIINSSVNPLDADYQVKPKKPLRFNVKSLQDTQPYQLTMAKTTRAPLLHKEHKPDTFDSGTPILTSNLSHSTDDVVPGAYNIANSDLPSIPKNVDIANPQQDTLITSQDDSQVVNTTHSSNEHTIIGIPNSKVTVNIGQNSLIRSNCSEYQKDIQHHPHKDQIMKDVHKRRKRKPPDKSTNTKHLDRTKF
uniref:Uncharacterized protein n=1 Tax=Cacopsylla melanoneura TaxID=428564 RepID=A0A8D8WWK5_9HEMI